MPKQDSIDIADLKLDLKNFRTVPQKSEPKMAHAMITISPKAFWALMESLLDDGFHLTDNVIVLEDASGNRIVKEGNRRLAALKIAHGLIKLKSDVVPDTIEEKLKGVTKSWKDETRKLPCIVYQQNEVAEVDKLVTLAHGKGVPAARDPWTAVARARHNREKPGKDEPALDLLEAYLKNPTNISPDQQDAWAGDYPLTVLYEMMGRWYSYFGLGSAKEFVTEYSKLPAKKRAKLDEILADIGTNVLTFPKLRTPDHAHHHYGLGPVPTAPAGAATSSSAGGTAAATSSTASTPPPKTPAKGPAKAAAASLPLSHAGGDGKAVTAMLKTFKTTLPKREKILRLITEASLLKLDKTPHAFCFLLRSIFELSARAYCEDQKNVPGAPTEHEPGGKDKKLQKLLQEVLKHITDKTPHKDKKALYGASSEMGKKHSPFSVISMHELIHNAHFSVSEAHIATVFSNVFPFLEAMNR